MVILIDTNVILDSMLERQPFALSADTILSKCNAGELTGYIAAHSIPTIFYITRKQFSISERKEMLSKLCGFIDIAGINKQQAINAIQNEHFDDIEDCLQAECAASIGADYIVTRNIADFTASPIPAILPEDFLAKD